MSSKMIGELIFKRNLKNILTEIHTITSEFDNVMKILVGTLYTIENEYDECCESISAQDYKNYDHVTYKDLPLRDAHHNLFKYFMDATNEYDLLIKIDADMVLLKNDFFTNIARFMCENRKIMHYQTAVYDFFTERLIGGLNSYRKGTKWDLDGNTVFVEGGHMLLLEKRQRVFDTDRFAPAAIHCKNPSPLQAFHFGVHKGYKVRDAIDHHFYKRAVEHCENVELTYRNFLKNPDIRLGLAALGGELALKGMFVEEHLNYSEPYMKEVLGKYADFNAAQLLGLIKGLRARNGGFLPPAERAKYIEVGWGKYLRKRFSSPRIRAHIVDVLKKIKQPRK